MAIEISLLQTKLLSIGHFDNYSELVCNNETSMAKQP